MPSLTTRTGALLASAALCMTVAATAAPADAAPAARHYANCSALRKDYKHGVGKVGAHDKVGKGKKPVTTFKRSNALYAANKGSDRDHDGVACELR